MTTDDTFRPRHDDLPADRPAEVSTRRRRAATWSLLLLAPVLAELAWGSTPFQMIWLLLLWIPIYGAGVLLIREAVQRVGGGWPSLVLLGVMYEIAEDGFGLQALTSPHLYGAADWGPRVLGLNTTYWETNALYHIAFSILIPITLADLLFPDLRGRPYLKRGGMIWTGITAVIGIGLVRVSVPPTMDPGYQAPVPYLIAFAVIGVVLAWVALRVLPGRRSAYRQATRRTDRSASALGRPPHPVALGVLSAIGAFAILFCTFPPAAGSGPALLKGNWTLVPMTIAILLAIAAAVLLVRWSGTAEWSDKHTLWVMLGALLAHTGYGLLVLAKTPLDRIGLLVMAGLTVAFFAWRLRAASVVKSHPQA